MQSAPRSAARRGRAARSTSSERDARGRRRVGRRRRRRSAARPSPVGFVGHADEAQAELVVLARLGRRRRLEHRVAARLGLGERHDLADVRLAGEERRPAIDAEGDPAVRRRAVLEGVEDGAELLAHPLDRLALQQEAALEQVAPVDADRAAAELPAVEREVVLHAPGPGRPDRPATGCAGSPEAVDEQRLVLGHARR